MTRAHAPRAAGVANALPPNRSRMRVFIKCPTAQVALFDAVRDAEPYPEFFSALAIPCSAGACSRRPTARTLRRSWSSTSAARRLFGTPDCARSFRSVAREPVPRLPRCGERVYPVSMDRWVKRSTRTALLQNMVLVARTAEIRASSRAASRRSCTTSTATSRSASCMLDDVVSEAVARQQFRTALFGSSPASAWPWPAGQNGVIVATVTLRANLLPYWVCHDSWAFASEAGRCRPHSADRGGDRRHRVVPLRKDGRRE